MYSQQGFSDQQAVEFRLCGYQLLVPSKHPLLDLFNPKSKLFQPYRELGFARIIQALQQQNRTGTVIDIGANVGDTCAIIHRYSTLKIICIDASDFFFPYLAKNVDSLFSDRAVARQAFVLPAAGGNAKGLYHWGGTAKAIEAPFTETCQTMSITDLMATADEVALLKVDTDGADIDLISSIFDNAGTNENKKPTFPIYFEFELSGNTIEDVRAYCEKSLAFFAKLPAAGYSTAFLWDDPGRFFGLIDLHDQSSIINAINYMGHGRHRAIYGLDICLVHDSDTAFAAELGRLIATETLVPPCAGSR